MTLKQNITQGKLMLSSINPYPLWRSLATHQLNPQLLLKQTSPNLHPIQRYSKSKQFPISPEIRIDEPTWKKVKTDALARSYKSSASAKVPRPSEHYENTF